MLCFLSYLVPEESPVVSLDFLFNMHKHLP